MNKLVLGAILAGLVYLVLLFATPLVRFQPWYKWWRDHQPQEGLKQTCLPMALLAYQSSATFLYGIASLFMISDAQKFDHSWQIEFLLNVMGRWAVDVAPTPMDFLTPYGLCTSIGPQKGDAFYTRQPNVSAKDQQWPTFNGWPQDVSDDLKTKWTSRQLWTGILYSWGCQLGANNRINYNSATWKTVDSNFLWQLYGIPGDSSLVASFVENSYADPNGTPWFPEALATLLGVNSDSGAGGWVGLMRAGGDWGDYGLISMEAYVWAENTSSLPKPSSPLNKCGTAGTASAIMQGLNMGALGAMSLAAVAPPFGIIAGGILGLIGGGVLGAAQYKCI